ncbi:adenosylhomocysteinase [Halorubrum sp. LN27]|uniref:adenosylhomocysteinase n=1 Tax=Halorubrum sp. LN27 TaxID=2801032 RepID=UPI0019091947|nr:adenosylhomocysteinase [Halorubrum sp. LN27]
MVERHHAEDPLARLRDRTPVLRTLAEAGAEDLPFEGTTVAVSSHLEPKTGIFIETLRDAGAEVLCTANDPGSVHGDVVAHLDAEPGITAFAEPGMSEADLDRAHVELLDRGPDVLATDGAELLAKLYAEPELSTDGVIGCTEQTTSGVSRARAMAADGVLDVPVFAVNHTPMKHWFDNVHGTGESALTNVMISTNTILSGRTVVVAGYGYVGRGVATKARAIGADTVVTEVDPRKAIRAHMDGHRVLPMDEAAEVGELFVTATGNCRVLRGRHFERLRDGATLCNVGHRDVEIAVPELAETAAEVAELEEGITRYTLPDGREIDVLAEGKLVNLTGPYSQGHPAAVMDSTFGAMFLAARELAVSAERDPGVHQLPERLDKDIARLKLDALGVEIDSLTDLQQRYRDAWRRDDIV